jgi:PAS domain S-box-containing protein
MDAEGCLTALNPRAEQLLGTTAEQAIGRPYPEVLGPSFSDRVLSLFLHVSRRGESGEPRVLEMALPGGRRATLLANLGPLRDGSGKLTGFLLAIEERTSVTDVNELAAKAEHLETTLKRYVGDLVGGFAGARPSFTQVGGSVQTISVIHADVRGFTTVAEVLPPEEVMALLLRYHSAAVASLDELRATMSRFIGDAILAFWNAPEPCSDHARVATQGALALRRAVEAVGSDLRYGIGIHTGEALVGNLGSEQFMNYTAIGRHRECGGKVARRGQTGRSRLLRGDPQRGWGGHSNHPARPAGGEGPQETYRRLQGRGDRGVSLQPGASFGPYEMVEQVGRGVLAAEDVNDEPEDHVVELEAPVEGQFVVYVNSGRGDVSDQAYALAVLPV